MSMAEVACNRAGRDVEVSFAVLPEQRDALTADDDRKRPVGTALVKDVLRSAVRPPAFVLMQRGTHRAAAIRSTLSGDRLDGMGSECLRRFKLFQSTQL
jgi:hypothetical protein